MTRLRAPLARCVALAGCGATNDPDVVEKGKAATGSSSSPKAMATAQGRILESGSGQQDGYVGLAALVENASDHAGQTVTVSFNLLDAKGNVLTTESQVDSFDTPGQKLAVVTQADVSSPRAIEPTLLIEDDGTFEEHDVDLGTAEGKVVKSEYGGWDAKFVVRNPTSDPLKSPAVRIICKDSAGKINGSGFTFPDFGPPSGQVVVDDAGPIVSGKPATCTAYSGWPTV
jgi:hypothetical protein